MLEACSSPGVPVCTKPGLTPIVQPSQASWLALLLQPREIAFSLPECPSNAMSPLHNYTRLSSLKRVMVIKCSSSKMHFLCLAFLCIHFTLDKRARSIWEERPPSLKDSKVWPSIYREVLMIMMHNKYHYINLKLYFHNKPNWRSKDSVSNFVQLARILQWGPSLVSV
jgi:hypothetical protein